MRDYKQDISIDTNDLESEWIEQPSLFLYYAEAHAEAIHLRDTQKSKLDLVYSEMYSDIKKNWEDYFENKPTEPAIKEYIHKDKKYRKAEKNLIEATKDVNILLATKTAFDHRKKALENLVSLRISGFHSEPKNKKRNILAEGGRREQKKMLKKNKRIRAKSRKM